MNCRKCVDKYIKLYYAKKSIKKIEEDIIMASLFAKERNQQLSEREALTSKYQNARHNILLVVVFTLINIILLVTNSNTYFLFSAAIPYYIADLGMFLCGKYPAEYYVGELAGMEFLNDTFLVVTLVIAAVILVLYLLSWILAKKPRVGWMIFALVFFVTDTAGMLLLTGISSDMIVDILFHGWVIVSLISGISAYFKLKKLPEEEELPQAEEIPQTIEE